MTASEVVLRSPRAARVAFTLVGLLALLGCALSVRNGLVSSSTIPEGAGYTHVFAEGWQNLSNQPMYFTFMSNALVAVTSLWLVWRPRLAPGLLQALHLCGLVCIIVTGVVFNVLLRGDDPMTPLQTFHDAVQHIATPVLAPLCWLVFGPLGAVTWRRIGLASLLPLAWLAVTLVRGAVLDWYPYSILDVPRLGYLGIMPWIASILVFFYLVATVLWVVDRRRR